MGGNRDFLISSSYLGDFDIKKYTVHMIVFLSMLTRTFFLITSG